MSAKQELLSELRIQRQEEPPRGAWVYGLIVFLLGVLGLALWWWLKPTPVTVSLVSVRALAVGRDSASSEAVLDATGYITARRQATVSAEITARVLEVLVEEGQNVVAGELLARLDDELPQANLALAQARRDEAHSNLREVEVNLVEAEANLQRIRELQQNHLASAQALDEIRARVGSLRARLASLGQSVQVAERGVVLELRRLDDTLIRAPFTGVVIDKAAQPGEIISPVSAGGGFTRTGLCTIVDMASLEIEVDVSESYINRVSSGQAVSAVLNSYPDWQIPAQVITLIPAADRNRATVRVRVALLEQDPRILPDMGVKVRFLAEPVTLTDSESESDNGSALSIPSSALWQESGRHYVFVWDGSSIQRRSISLGTRLGNEQRIQAGLREGEQVVNQLNAELAAVLSAGQRQIQVTDSNGT